MIRQIMSLLLSVSLLCFLGSFDNNINGPEAEIKERVKQYQNAFNQGDAKTLAKLWAEDATYINPESGEVTTGRDSLEKQFQERFDDSPGVQIDIAVSSIKFPQTDQAIELGTATLKKNGEVIDETAYKANYKKKNGEWLLTQVREVESQEPPAQNEHLKELDWLIGDWIDTDEDSTVTSSFQWDKYKNFLTQNFSVNAEGKFEIEGKQIIVWDPIHEKIRSWIFDSDGGFGEGSWKKKGNNWIVETAQTLADGRRASSTNIYTPIDANSFTWQSVGREVGGELLPDIAPVTVVRKKG